MMANDFQGGPFASAWLAVAEATGSDKGDSSTFRTIMVEQFEDGVRLSAADRSIFAQAWVADKYNPFALDPDIDEAAIRTCIVMDIDKRVTQLMKHTLGLHRASQKEDPTEPEPVVSLSTRRNEGEQQTLSPDFVGHEMVFDLNSGTELVAAGLYEGSPYEYRSLLTATGEPRTVFTVGPVSLGKVMACSKHMIESCRLVIEHQPRTIAWRYESTLEELVLVSGVLATRSLDEDNGVYFGGEQAEAEAVADREAEMADA